MEGSSGKKERMSSGGVRIRSRSEDEKAENGATVETRRGDRRESDRR